MEYRLPVSSTWCVKIIFLTSMHIESLITRYYVSKWMIKVGPTPMNEDNVELRVEEFIDVFHIHNRECYFIFFL